MGKNYEISELKPDGYYQITSKDLAGEIVADIHASAIYSGKAEAEYICKAVNNYDSLLEALKETVKTLDFMKEAGDTFYSGDTSRLNKAKEAIKKAEQ